MLLLDEALTGLRAFIAWLKGEETSCGTLETASRNWFPKECCHLVLDVPPGLPLGLPPSAHGTGSFPLVLEGLQSNPVILPGRLGTQRHPTLILHGCTSARCPPWPATGHIRQAGTGSGNPRG